MFTCFLLQECQSVLLMSQIIMNNLPPPFHGEYFYIFLCLFILPIWQTGCALLNTEKSKFVSCLNISTQKNRDRQIDRGTTNEKYNSYLIIQSFQVYCCEQDSINTLGHHVWFFTRDFKAFQVSLKKTFFLGGGEPCVHPALTPSYEDPVRTS